MKESKVVIVVDSRQERREALIELAQGVGLLAFTVEDVDDGFLEDKDDSLSFQNVGTIGHSPDLMACLAEGYKLKTPVVHYRGGRFEIRSRDGHIKYPEPIDPGPAGVRLEAKLLKQAFVSMRDGGDVSKLLQSYRDLLSPILPFGVLLDWYGSIEQMSGLEDWLKTVAEVVESAPDFEGGSDYYWSELAVSTAAVERATAILAESGSSESRFAEVLRQARALDWPGTHEGVNGASSLLMAARDAVRDAWTMAGKAYHEQGAPLQDTEFRTVVHAASIGFYVLAAVHL
jgi:hypothetical protein